MIEFIIFVVAAFIIHMRLKKVVNTLPEKGEVDDFPLIGALLVTAFCVFIVAIGIILSDKVAEPIQYALGATPIKVKEASVALQFGKNISSILLSIPLIFVVAYTLFRYLGDGFTEYGFWTLPRKSSHY